MSWPECAIPIGISFALFSSPDVAASDRAHTRTSSTTAVAPGNWPQWRGASGTGVAGDHADPPIHWSEEKNIRWRVGLPGSGHSTPIVWGDRVFVTTAMPTEKLPRPIPDTAPGGHDNRAITHKERFSVLALDRRDGTLLWQKVVHEEVPHEGGHYTGTFASASPATDGELVFAFFGSRGLYAVDKRGELEWQVDLGDMVTLHGHGEGSSPVLHADTLVVNWDHEEESFVVAFDKRTGEERWKVQRDEVTSWASPIVVEHDGKPQVIISGTQRVRGYDLGSGAILWECGGLSHNVVASPVAADGMVFVGSSYEKRALFAIRLDGSRGDITGTDRIAWSRTHRTPYVPSPLLYRGSLYFLRHYQGILSRVEAATGKETQGPYRLFGMRDIYASPVAAAGRIYVTDRNGTTVVLRHEDPSETLAINRLDDSFSASAAIADQEIFLRGERSLYCIARDRDGTDIKSDETRVKPPQKR